MVDKVHSLDTLDILALKKTNMSRRWRSDSSKSDPAKYKNKIYSAHSHVNSANELNQTNAILNLPRVLTTSFTACPSKFVRSLAENLFREYLMPTSALSPERTVPHSTQSLTNYVSTHPLRIPDAIAIVEACQSFRYHLSGIKPTGLSNSIPYFQIICKRHSCARWIWCRRGFNIQETQLRLLFQEMWKTQGSFCSTSILQSLYFAGPQIICMSTLFLPKKLAKDFVTVALVLDLSSCNIL